MDRQLLDDDDLHASAVVANCAMNRDRQLAGVNSYDRELGFDPDIRIAGQPATRRLSRTLRAAGFSYDSRRRRISRTGKLEAALPYRYLGADERTGPNYTGQPSVTSHYE